MMSYALFEIAADEGAATRIRGMVST